MKICLIFFILKASAVVFHIPDIKWVTQLQTQSFSYDLPEVPDLPLQIAGGKQRINVFLSHENPTTLKTYMSNALTKHGFLLTFSKFRN